MNASGGVAAPLNDASEEFGANAPRNKQFGDDNDASASKSGTSGSNNNSGTSTSSNIKTSTTTSGQHKSTSSTQQTSSSAQSSSHSTHGFHAEHGNHDLENVSREKAKRFVNLNEEDVQHAGADQKDKDAKERSSQRAPRDVGPKEDIELLHGKAEVGEGDDGGEQRGGGGKSGGDGKGSGKQGSDSGKDGAGKGGVESSGSGTDPMRHNAAKFVNIQE